MRWRHRITWRNDSPSVIGGDDFSPEFDSEQMPFYRWYKDSCLHQRGAHSFTRTRLTLLQDLAARMEAFPAIQAMLDFGNEAHGVISVDAAKGMLVELDLLETLNPTGPLCGRVVDAEREQVLFQTYTIGLLITERGPSNLVKDEVRIDDEGVHYTRTDTHHTVYGSGSCFRGDIEQSPVGSDFPGLFNIRELASGRSLQSYVGLGDDDGWDHGGPYRVRVPSRIRWELKPLSCQFICEPFRGTFEGIVKGNSPAKLDW